MPTRDYSTRAAYDADYRAQYPGTVVALPGADIVLDGVTITDVNSAWTRPKIGGSFRLSLGRAHVRTLNRSEITITGIAGNVYTTDNPRAWPATALSIAPAQVRYVVRPVWLNYDSAFLGHPQRGVAPTMARLFAFLGVTPADRIVLVGAGLGHEVQGAIAAGFANVIGTEDTRSYWNGRQADDAEELSSLQARLTAAGYDPAVGEGADILATLQTYSIRAASETLVKINDMKSPVKRRALTDLIGGDPTFVISLFVLSVLTDQEAFAFSSVMADWAQGPVDPARVHYTPALTQAQQDVIDTEGSAPWPLPGRREGDNWKTLTDWKALLPNDTIVAESDGSFGSA